jgi:acyl-CoA thioesterase-1
MVSPILFIGDSITDAGRHQDPEHLGFGFVRMAAAELATQGDARPVINAGVGGDRTVDLRARWETDALDPAPELLTVYVGINDTWRRYDDDDPTSADDFAATYWTLLDDAQERLSPRMILVEPFVMPVTSEQQRWGAEDLDAKRRVVADLAAQFGAAFVPLQSLLMDAAEQNGGAAAIAADGVHPTELGATLIAGAWLNAAASL